jgi:hypothetical protein
MRTNRTSSRFESSISCFLFDNPGYGESHVRTAEAHGSAPHVSLADQAAAFAAIARIAGDWEATESRSLFVMILV